MAVLSEQSWCGCGGHIVSVSHCAWPLRSAPQPPHCAVVPPLVTTHITLIHGAEMLWRPTVSTPATVTYIVRIVQLLTLRMKELLNSKPPALHLERPLGPMLPCPAAWPEQSSGRTQHWPPLLTTTHQHCHNYSHLTVLLLRTFGASTNNMDTKKESNMSSRVCPCCTYNINEMV